LTSREHAVPPFHASTFSDESARWCASSFVKVSGPARTVGYGRDG